MIMTGNTILITGGGTGIGRGLAEAFHKLNNQVIISGRRPEVLEETIAANPGMKSLVLDVADPASIRTAAATIIRDHPTLNVLINNAGVMTMENLKSNQDVEVAERIVAANLLGPIRLTAALLPLLQRQPRSTVMTVSSGLAFVPLAATPTYCAAKAAIHSYSLSLRWQLQGSSTEVIELIPPYVQTHLMGEHQSRDPRAMPLQEFIAEAMRILTTQPDAKEICVENVKPQRTAAESGNFDRIFNGLNEAMSKGH